MISEIKHKLKYICIKYTGKAGHHKFKDKLHKYKDNIHRVRVSLVRERLQSYPQVSEMSLYCTPPVLDSIYLAVYRMC